jgi:hypothetical protein
MIRLYSDTLQKRKEIENILEHTCHRFQILTKPDIFLEKVEKFHLRQFDFDDNKMQLMKMNDIRVGALVDDEGPRDKEIVNIFVEELEVVFKERLPERVLMMDERGDEFVIQAQKNGLLSKTDCIAQL